MFQNFDFNNDGKCDMQDVYLYDSMFSDSCDNSSSSFSDTDGNSSHGSSKGSNKDSTEMPASFGRIVRRFLTVLLAAVYIDELLRGSPAAKIVTLIFFTVGIIVLICLLYKRA